MRKIYDEYLYVPEQGEGVVREKVFFSRLVLSIACMVVCMIAMGYNAYAFFTANVESTSNMLQAATYSFEVKGTTVIADDGSFKPTETGAKHEYILEKGTYDFELIKQEDATATTGYGKIVIGGDNGFCFYTQQIGGVYEGDTEIKSRTIRITVDSDTTVKFVECWGTYVGNTIAEVPSEVITAEQKMIEVKGTTASAVIYANPTTTDSNTQNPTAVTSTDDTTSKEPVAQDSGTTATVPETTTQATETSGEIKDETTETPDGTTKETTGEENAPVSSENTQTIEQE